MWLGKLSIIMYIFSIAVLFMGYYINTTLETTAFSSSTFASLKALADKNEVNTAPNTDLIFGDFISGVTVVFGIITGDTVAQLFGQLPLVTDTWEIFTRILFTLSTAFLWINIITGRDL